jgi:hypothetical protein
VGGTTIGFEIYKIEFEGGPKGPPFSRRLIADAGEQPAGMLAPNTDVTPTALGAGIQPLHVVFVANSALCVHLVQRYHTISSRNRS